MTRISAGILVFQDRWLAWREHSPRAAAAVTAARRLLAAPVHRLLTMPTPHEAARLGRLLHEDNDGGWSTRPIVNTALAASDHTCLWPAGVCEVRSPGENERQWRLAAGAPDGAADILRVVSAATEAA